MVLGSLDVWLVALVLLLLAGLLLRLQALSLVVVGAVLRQLGYPALGAIAPLSAYPVEWGPVVLLLLLLLRIAASVLRRMLLLMSLGIVLGRHLGLAMVFLLQKRVEVVLVLLGRRGQMRTAALLPVLASLQTLGLVQLLLSKPRVAFADRLVSSQAVLAGLSGGLVFLVAPRKTCDAAAERLLGLLDGGRRRLRLVGAMSLVNTGRQLRLLLVALRHLVEMGAQAVGARRPGGIRVLLLLLLLLLILALERSLGQLLAVHRLVSLCSVVVHRERWTVSRTHTYVRVHVDWRPNRALHSPEGFGDDWPELDASTDWCERFDFLENIDGIAVAGFVAARSSSGDAAGCELAGRRRGGLS